MRCAERGPTPGSTRSASMRRSSPAGLPTTSLFISERQFQSGRQSHPGGKRTHFFLHHSFRFLRRVVERGDEEVFEHLAVGGQRRVDAHAAHFMLAGQGHFHHAGTRLAFHFQAAELFLQAAHVLLHHLRLLHHLADIAFHRCLSRMVESTTLPSKRLTRSCTKLSPCTAFTASARRSPFTAFSSAAAVAPRVSPSTTCTFTGRPKCAASTACSFSR